MQGGDAWWSFSWFRSCGIERKRKPKRQGIVVIAITITIIVIRGEREKGNTVVGGKYIYKQK